MSLINKMLKDLETRQNASAGDESRELLYRDLRPVGRARKRSRRTFLLVGVSLLTVAGTTLFAWDHWGTSIVSGKLAEWAPGMVGHATLAHSSSVLATYRDAAPARPASTRTPLMAAPSVGQTQVAAVADTAARVMPPPTANHTPTDKKQSSTEKPNNKLAKAKVKTKKAATRKKPTTAKERIVDDAEKPAPAAEKAMLAPIEPKDPASPPGDWVQQGVIEKKLRSLTLEDQAENAYHESVRSLQQERVAEAEEKLRFVLATDPQHTKARELLVGLLLQRGGWAEAEQLLHEGRDANSEDYRFAQLLARIYIQRGADDKALALLEQAQVYAKTDAEFLGFLAALYQRAGRHEQAIKAYGRAVTMKPQQSQWWLGLGISLEAERNWNAAHQAYARAVNERGLNKKLAQYARQRLAFTKTRINSE